MHAPHRNVSLYHFQNHDPKLAKRQHLLTSSPKAFRIYEESA